LSVSVCVGLWLINYPKMRIADVDMGKLDRKLLAYYSRFYPEIVKRLLLLFGEQDYEAK